MGVKEQENEAMNRPGFRGHANGSGGSVCLTDKLLPSLHCRRRSLDAKQARFNAKHRLARRSWLGQLSNRPANSPLNAIRTLQGERPGHRKVDRPPGSELRRSDADSRAVAQLVDVVRHVQEREPRVELSKLAQFEAVRHGDVQLTVAGEVFGIDKASA
jgi:hypothetical protein